jgi:hypothetical protein
LMHLRLYVTVTVNVGPVKVGGVKVPAHTPIVTGAIVALPAASVVGTPTGASNVNPFPVDGHAPRTSVLVTDGLSGAVPWLSMQKNSC